VNSLSGEVAIRYGHVEERIKKLELELRAAVAAKDWNLVNDISARLTDKPK
jgi:hypothetical protein